MSTDTVFKAITEQEELTQWFPDQAILEPRVLGKMRFTTLKEIHPEWKLDRLHNGRHYQGIRSK